MDAREQALGAATAGVWTTAAARAAGLTAQQVRGRLMCGEWQRLRRGAYADGGVQPSPLMRASAAVLVCGGEGRAIAAGRTAARLWGFPLVDDDDPATKRREADQDDVLVRHGTRPRPTLLVRRVALGPGDVCRVRGVPVLSPLRTVVDLALLLRPDALVCVLDQALHRGRVTRADLDDAAERLRWCPGAPALRMALGRADARSESPLETLTRLTLQPVLPRLTPQHVVLDRAARVVARIDLADLTLRLGIEADGAAWHRGDATLAADRRRERRLAAQGWTTERCTWFEVRRRPEELRARVAAAARRLASR